MGDRNAIEVSRRERQPPEWMVFALAVTLDISIAAGFVPSAYSSLLRSLVMFCLYREWVLAVACGFVLPRFVPLAGVCFLKQKWLAFKGQLKAMAATAKERAAAAAANAPNAGQAGGGGNSSSHRNQRRARGEVSGYDVSAVSSEEVVELSSWKTRENTSSTRGDISGARQRRAPR